MKHSLKYYNQRYEALLKEQQMLNESVVDWFNKHLALLKGQVIIIDWNKTEQRLGGSIPQEVREKVEECVNGRKFTFYTYQKLGLFLMSTIGVIGFLTGVILLPEAATAGSVAKVFTGLVINLCLLIIMEKWTKKEFVQSGITKYANAFKKYKLGDEISADMAWESVIENLHNSGVDGNHWLFSRFFWLSIILYVLSFAVDITLIGAGLIGRAFV